MSQIEEQNIVNRYYLEYVPIQNKAGLDKCNCIYDPDNKKWYTPDKANPMLNRYKLQAIDFEKFSFDNNILFDPVKNMWYTYRGNLSLENYFITK